MAVKRLLSCAVLLALAGCASPTDSRTLHVVDGELVQSDAPPPAAYEMYLRARLALDADPPDPKAALGFIDRAILFDPESPQLWVTRAEVREQLGDTQDARASLARALELDPGYEPAREMLGRLSQQGVES